MSLIHNERTKLSATLLNTIAATFVAAGVVAPLVAVYYGFGGPSPGMRPGLLLLGIATWLLTALGLHIAARRVLGSLKP